jgi:cell division protease FtsH
MAKRKGLIRFLTIALIIVLIFVAYSAFSNLNRGEVITRSEFYQMLKNDEVSSVYITGSSARVRKVGSKITEDQFKRSSAADYVFEIEAGAEISTVTDWIDLYNEGKLERNVLDADGKITYDSDGEPIMEYANKDGLNIISYNTRPAQESLFSRIMPYLSLIFVAILAFFIIRSITATNNKSISFGKTKARNTQVSKVKFSDVAGAKEEKQELVELVDFLKNPKKYTDLGARIPKGVLLVGPPGTGKTLLAKAVAGESSVPFFKISGSDFVEMFVGVGASRVRDLFDQAKQNSPCIIFIDEIDAVGRQRGAGLGGGNDEREQTLNQLLVEMDGFESNEGIIVMAATNRPDVLDPALLRPGRFDRQIVVNMPDIKEREAILKVHAKNKKFAENVSFENIARITSGFAGADLENLLNEAAILAGRNNRPRITMIDINEAANKVMMGPQKKSHLVTDRDKKITAYHESGHTILHKLLPNTDDVQEVSIVPRGMAGGYTMSRPDSDDNYATYGKLNDMICTLMGGRIAEEIIFKDITTGASNDIEKATKLARRMVTQFGMSSKLGFINLGSTSEVFIGRDYQNQVEYSEKTAGIIDEEVQKILKENYEKATKLLNDNIDKLHAMAELLLKVETIYNEEVNKVMQGVSNEEIIASLKDKEEAEQEELAKERELKLQQDKQKIEELKNRAFEAMRESGMLKDDEIEYQKEHETSQVSEDITVDKTAKTLNTENVSHQRAEKKPQSKKSSSKKASSKLANKTKTKKDEKTKKSSKDDK